MPWHATSTGLRLELQARPGRPKTVPTGLKPLADGGVALAIDVAAPPEDGKANDALIAALAKLLGLQRSAVRIATGASARRKSLQIDGDAARLAAQLAGWLATKK
ncbi:hypothetical protein TMPK1_35480 [Rhodospirillales bacterium TMPK1]|uniref:UPF0235 protein TMPK1_35480 n=1 Tax=Roseiterribacter gracilis TaxID=2812848 RepID=A0A8S8XH45_9PROT|nr:hypothetical protein TMPK1_35480 [Rhodospirillales bacterium TMPK1]